MQSEGSDILKTDGTTAESLKGAPQDHRPCADDVCSPTEREKGPSPLHSAGISLGSDASLQVRTREGEGIAEVTQQASGPGLPNPDVVVPFNKSVNARGQPRKGSSWSALSTCRLPRAQDRVWN